MFHKPQRRKDAEKNSAPLRLRGKKSFLEGDQLVIAVQVLRQRFTHEPDVDAQ